MKKDLYISKEEHNDFLKENGYEGKMKILLQHSKKNSLRIGKEKIMEKEKIENSTKEKKENFIKKAFREMGESAKAQHQVDKANFEAIKAESKANFEENRGTNTLKKAKAIGKQSWEDAKLTPAERTAKTREKQAKQIEEANARIEEANVRYEKVKVIKKKSK